MQNNNNNNMATAAIQDGDSKIAELEGFKVVVHKPTCNVMMTTPTSYIRSMVRDAIISGNSL